MPRAGKSFEDLTETIFRSLTDDDADVQLERNVYLPGPDGDREIDILIRSHVGPIPLTTVVECRDYKSIINVTQLDAFHSKLEDVNASKGVMVSRRGFSKTARQKAERLGISLYTAGSVIDPTHFAYDVPIAIRRLKPIELQFACQYVVPSPTEIDHSAFLRLNDLSIADYLREDIGTAHDRGELSPGPRVWEPTDILRPMYIRDESGVKLEVEKMQVSYQIEAKYKFGYLQDFDTVLFLNEEIERSEAALLLPADELTFDPSRFATFDSEREFPVEPKLAISVLEVPETEPKIADVEVIRVS